MRSWPRSRRKSNPNPRPYSAQRGVVIFAARLFSGGDGLIPSRPRSVGRPDGERHVPAGAVSAAGKSAGPSPGRYPGGTPSQRVGAFSQGGGTVGRDLRAIGLVVGDDGRPPVESRGVDSRECSAWRDVLSKIDEELIIWASTFRRKFGTAPGPSAQSFAEEDESEFDGRGDQYADTYDD